MHVNRVGKLIPGSLQHRGPEQGVEVRDVLPDKVMNLALGIPPPPIEVEDGWVLVPEPPREGGGGHLHSRTVRKEVPPRTGMR